MSVDVEGLRSTIQSIRQQIARQGIVGLDDDVVRLEQIADAAEAEPPDAADSAATELSLPSEIVVPRPDAVNQYVRAYPELADLARDMATALVEEFRGERSEIELDLYQDPEIDDRYLVFYVRLPEYDDSLMPRIRTISEQVDSRVPPTPEWVHVSTDYRPAQ